MQNLDHPLDVICFAIVRLKPFLIMAAAAAKTLCIVYLHVEIWKNRKFREEQTDSKVKLRENFRLVMFCPVKKMQVMPQAIIEIARIHFPGSPLRNLPSPK